MLTLGAALRGAWTWTREAFRAYWGPPIWASNSPHGFGSSGPTASGIAVSEWGALNLTAIWCGVQVIAGGIASLPLILYKRVGEDKRERFYDHPLYRILHDEPNPDMSAPMFWQTVIQHALLWGNGYAEIRRDGANRVRRLDLITPDRVQIKRDTLDGAVYYLIANQSRGPARIDAAEMVHLPGLGYDGVCGYSVVGLLRESLGLSLAADRFGSTFFGNSAQPGGVLEMDGAFTNKTTRDQFKAELEEFRGSGSHKTLILENGMAWKQTTIPPDDAQFLETRKFQVEEIARILNVPLHKLHSMDRATFSNIEQQAKEFLSDTLLPWLAKITAECNRKLIAPSERNIQYTEHLVDERLRVDIQSRYAAYRVARDMGVFNARQICAMENVDPPPDAIADIYLVPANMVQLGVMPEPTPGPAPPPDPAPTAAADETNADPAPTATPELPILLADVAQLREDVTRLPESLRLELVSLIPPPVEPIDLDALRESLRDQILAALPPPVEAPPPHADTSRQLHEWQHATIEMLVGRMVRKELAAVRKWATKPTPLTVGEAFFDRWVSDGVDSLRPWLIRLQNGSGPLDVPVRGVLERWAAARIDEFKALPDLGAMIPQWEAHHERLLMAEMVEVLYAHAQ